jgi:hypothetical protein
MSAFKNDNTVQYGSIVLTIGTFAAGTPPTISSTTTFVADNFTITRPSKTIERTNEIDEPSGQVSYLGFVTGSAQLQLASGSTLYPLHGKHFTVTLFDTDGSGSNDAEYFYIDSVDQPLVKDGEKKVPITFRKIYNTAS